MRLFRAAFRSDAVSLYKLEASASGPPGIVDLLARVSSCNQIPPSQRISFTAAPRSYLVAMHSKAEESEKHSVNFLAETSVALPKAKHALRHLQKTLTQHVAAAISYDTHMRPISSVAHASSQDPLRSAEMRPLTAWVATTDHSIEPAVDLLHRRAHSCQPTPSA